MNFIRFKFVVGALIQYQLRIIPMNSIVLQRNMSQEIFATMLIIILG